MQLPAITMQNAATTVQLPAMTMQDVAVTMQAEATITQPWREACH
jgi:hypothetical protein